MYICVCVCVCVWFKYIKCVLKSFSLTNYDHYYSVTMNILRGWSRALKINTRFHKNISLPCIYSKSKTDNTL